MPQAKRIKRSLLGGHVVEYDCLACGQALDNPLEDTAGTEDVCPTCGARHVVPGKATADKLERKRKEQPKARGRTWILPVDTQWHVIGYACPVCRKRLRARLETTAAKTVPCRRCGAQHEVPGGEKLNKLVQRGLVADEQQEQNPETQAEPSAPEKTGACPYCKNAIHAEATICEHCGSAFTHAAREEQKGIKSAAAQTSMGAGLAAVLMFFLLPPTVPVLVTALVLAVIATVCALIELAEKAEGRK